MSTPKLDMSRLDAFARRMVEGKKRAIGYPVNQNVQLADFYLWFAASGLAEVAMNNVGDPRKESLFSLNTHEFENEVIDFFAPLYGFAKDETWGIVTASGTDGNNHGLYFGVKSLAAQAPGRTPILYVSEEAHYSIRKLGDLQNLEMRQIRADVRGRIDVADFERALDPWRPALVVIAVGTTFKGAIDDQEAIDAVLRRKRPVAVYRHVDAALFGGFLPFSEHADIVDRRLRHFDSIAVSGHKFFGFDEPLGLFVTTREVLARQNPFRVVYLNDAVPTLTCSRSALGPLKFWWQIHRTGIDGYRRQARGMLRHAALLEERLHAIGHPAWRNDCSNTVYFRRPGAWVMDKWGLAPGEDPRLGGPLAHDIVMRHEDLHTIDAFVRDLSHDRAGRQDRPAGSD